jgi:hypothetical protein
MTVKNWGVTGTIIETGATESAGPYEKALIILDAGSATVDVEIQPPESSAWVKAEIGLDASADVVKVYEAPACKIRLNCTAYTSDTPFWIVESSNKS